MSIAVGFFHLLKSNLFVELENLISSLLEAVLQVLVLLLKDAKGRVFLTFILIFRREA